MEEEWRPIKGYEGLYEVSNMGRVKSYKRNKVEIISPMNTSTGYKQVEFAKDGISKRKLVHRLALIRTAKDGKGPVFLSLLKKQSFVCQFCQRAIEFEVYRQR